MTANRVRRLPSVPGACSTARRKISMTHTLDLPLPTGPMQQRTKALQSRNSARVGGASYLMRRSGKFQEVLAQLARCLVEADGEQLLELLRIAIRQALSGGYGDVGRALDDAVQLDNEPPRPIARLHNGAFSVNAAITNPTTTPNRTPLVNQTIEVKA